MDNPNSQKIFLNDQIPIRIIQKPFCEVCMNKVEEDILVCPQCEKPPPIGKEWYFNRIISLGHYKTYPNESYNNIPKNILSRMILVMKGNVKKEKLKVGKLLADGLVKVAKKYEFLIDNLKYIIIPPKYDIQEKNQCEFILKPFIEIAKKEGLNLVDLSKKVIRIKDIGKIRDIQNREAKFKAMYGTHEIKVEDLNGEKILVLDDISTAKSTIWDLSRALKKKNAGEINLLTVGRTLFNDESDFSTDLSYDELQIYFNLDFILNTNKINDVVIDSYEISDDKSYIKCECRNYKIHIDFKNSIIFHNCRDFEVKKYRNKSFCKHLTQLFIQLRNDKGEPYVRSILSSIYSNLFNWDFEIKI